MKVSTYKKLYAFVIMIGPVVCQYSIANVMELDIVAMLIVMLIGFSAGIRSKGVQRNEITLLIIYTATVTLCNLLFGSQYAEVQDIILRCGRYCLIMYFVLLKNIDYFDYGIALKYYRKIVYFAFLYIVIQAFAYYTMGIVLPNKIGENTSNLYVEGFGRLRSFYSEPAALSYGILPFTACSLFGPKYEDKNMMVDAIVSSVAIILSTSGQGNIGLAAIWVIWLIIWLRQKKISHSRFAIMLIIIAAAVYLVGSPIVGFTFGRVNSLGQGGAISARASGYTSLSVLNTMQHVFGTGYGNYIVRNDYGINTLYSYIYYSSLADYLFTTGIIGTFMLIVIFIKRFHRSELNVKILIVVTLILSLGGAPLSGANIPLYFSLIFSSYMNATTKQIC